MTLRLGTMTCYTFGGKGVKVAAIVDVKIAQKAGIKSGDVIIQLGDYSCSDIYSYMDVLSGFKKGDATNVTVLRGKDQIIFDIIF